MSFLSDIVKKVKSNFSDDKGFFRGNKFTPVTQITGKPLNSYQTPTFSSSNRPSVIPTPQPQFPTLETPKPSFKTNSAEKLNSRLEMIKNFGTSSANKLKTIGSIMANEVKEQNKIKYGDTSVSIDNQFKTSMLGKGYDVGKNIVTKTLPTFAKEVVTPPVRWAWNTGQELAGKSGQDLEQLKQDEAIKQKLLWNKLNTAKKYRDMGDIESATRLEEEVKQGINKSNRFDAFEQDIEQRKNQLKADAIKTGMTVASAGKPVSIPSLLLAGGIGAGSAALQGEDPYTTAGESMANAQRWKAVTQFTDPLTGKTINTFVKPKWNELGRQVASRLISGTGNLIEDNIIDKLESKERGIMDNISAFVIGAVMSNGGKNAGKWKKGDFTKKKLTKDIKKTIKADWIASGKLDPKDSEALDKVIDRIIMLGVKEDGDLSGMKGGGDINSPLLPKKYYYNKYADKVLEVNPNISAHIGEPIFDSLEEAQKIASSPRELQLAKDAWKKSHPTNWIGNESKRSWNLEKNLDGKTPQQFWKDAQSNLSPESVSPIKTGTPEPDILDEEVSNLKDKKGIFAFAKKHGINLPTFNEFKKQEDIEFEKFKNGTEYDTPEPEPKTELDWLKENNKKNNSIKPINDILANRDYSKPQPIMVKGVDISNDVNKMMAEGWKPDEIDYAIKLANESKVQAPNKDWGAYVRGILKKGQPVKASGMGGKGVVKQEPPTDTELAKSDYNAKLNEQELETTPKIEEPVIKNESKTTKVTTQEPKVDSRASSEVTEPKKTKINEILPTKKTIKDQIDEFTNSQPPKNSVIGKDAETATKDLTTKGHSIVQQITEGIKKTGTSKEDFIKYIQNPELAPDSIKPAVEAHIKLMESTYSLRENPNLGKIENYYPHMSDDYLQTPSELKNIGDDLFISSKTMELGSSKKRTGKLTDYSQEYDSVMKEYINQTAYDKYGKRIGMKPEDAEFKDKLDEHLKPVDDSGNLEQPNDKFDYINEVSVKDNVVKKEKIRAKANPLTTFDSLRREISKESGAEGLNRSMEDVRDVEDKNFELIAKMEKLSNNKDKVKLLIDNLDFLKNKPDIVDSLNRTNNISNATINSLLRAEKDFKIQNFITEAAKYDFEPQTQKYLNKEIDKMTKVGRYEQTLFNKAVNLITRTFYKAQIWGNVNTGLKQKGESLRIPVLYSPDKIKAATKQWNIDRKTGRDILADYDFKNLSTDYSRQLGIDTKSESKVSKAGNLFVNAGESSKNRDFLYVAEAEGKANGLSGDELKRFVRNELFANGFILHKFNTPKILDNPLFRLGLQYQQYNMKTLTRALELNHQGETAKAGGIIGTQAASALLLLGITNAGIETVKNNIGIGLSPAISLPYQIGKYIYDNAQKDENKKQPIGGYLVKTGIRNVMPFGNQILKTYGAGKILLEGRSESARGNVNYVASEKNPIRIAQALVFGQGSLEDKKEADRKFRKLSTEGIYPTLTAEQSKVLKSLPKEEQRAYYDKQMALQTKNTDIVKARTGEEKQSTIDKIFNKKKIDPNASLVPAEGATPEERKKFESTIKEFINSGNTYKVEDDEWNSYFFDEVNKMPESDSIEKHQKEIKRWDKIKSIENNQDLDQETKDKIIANSGVSKDDLEYYKNASLDNGSKKVLITKIASQEDRNAVIQSLIEAKRVVGNKALSSNTETDYLYDMGLISKEEKKLIDSWKYDEIKGDFYQDRDYKPSGSGEASAKSKKLETARKALFDDLEKLNKPSKKSKLIENILQMNQKKVTEPKTVGSILESTRFAKKKVTQNSSNTGNIKSVKRIYRFKK